MNKQTLNYKEKNQMFSDYLSKNNVYKSVSSERIILDLRGYSEYIKRNKLDISELTPLLEQKFIKKK